MPTPYQEEFVEVAGAKIQLLKGGQGDPLVLFHSIEGSLGWRRYHDQLAEQCTVYAPTLPGFGASERPDWVESFFDLARFSLWLVQALGLEKSALGGHFIGGWLAQKPKEHLLTYYGDWPDPRVPGYGKPFWGEHD